MADLFKFNGSFTIRNRETGEHRTFRVKTQPDNAAFAAGERLVGLLSGSDNEGDYTNFAFVKSGGIFVWKKHRGQNGKKSAYEWYALMLWALATNAESDWHRKYELMIEKRCIRCNRKLTHPESIETGIGPECAKRA